jgi:16S rRNA (cytosine967-C5)-methyltransferase
MAAQNAKSDISPARTVAFDMLMRVEQHGAYASELLHSQTASRLSATDHGLATELVMGVLRWRAMLDRMVAEFSSQTPAKLDLEVLTALRLATYQLRFLERIPAHAAINESVELVKRARKRSATGFVNAVLRKIAARPKDSADMRAHDLTAEELANQSSHPRWLVERWMRSYGMQNAAKICRFDQERPTTAIRLCEPVAESELREQGIELGRGELLASARRVVSGDVTRTAAYRSGSVVIQDEASQLVALLVGRGRRILDCCAAPGGKTSILARRNAQAKIVAIELHPHRARLLRSLVDADNVDVVSADARSLPLRADFDRILADVPCSGTGTLARNPDIKWRLKPEDIRDLQDRQLAILRAAAEALRPGGRVVYSTCSLEGEENSCVVDAVLKQSPDLKVIDASSELDKLRGEGELSVAETKHLVDGPYLRTIPGMQNCDGFFAAILEKS